jgi:RecA-family ATPase
MKPSRSERDFTLAKELKLHGFTLEETGKILWSFKHGKVRDVPRPNREVVRCYERSGNDFSDFAQSLPQTLIDKINKQVNPVRVAQQERKEKMEKEYGVWGGEASFQDSSVPIFMELLDRETVVLVYGPSNSGKSFLMLDAAVHLASGKDWAGHKCAEKMAAIVIATEAGKAYGKRVVAARRRVGVADNASPQEFPFKYYPVRVDFLKNKDDLKLVRKWIDDVERESGYKVGMVVIDTMAASFGGGNENSPDDAGKYLNNMIDIKYDKSVTPVIVHHAGKDESAGARGHSSLKGNVDTEVRVKSARRGEKYIRSFTPTKQRDDETDNETHFGLKKVELGKNKYGGDITTCNVVFGGEQDFDDVSAALTDGLSVEAVQALKAISDFHRIPARDMKQIKWTEKQIKMLLYFDILKEKQEDKLFYNEEGELVHNIPAKMKVMGKTEKRIEAHFDRACKELAEAEITKDKPKYQLISEGIDVE